jgi:CheY-like chemotaxis protein
LTTLVGQGEHGEEPWGLVVDARGRRYALAVAKILGEADLVRRPADALLGRTGLVAATAVLDDGRCVLFPSLSMLARSVEARPRTAPAGARRRRRVLVVDDSPIVRDLVTSILQAVDLDARGVGDGEAALVELERGLPDLLLSDVEMPRVDGFELLRRVRARWPLLPVVMLTTRGSAEDRRQAVTLGANAYVVKSEFEEGRLVDTIRALMEREA